MSLPKSGQFTLTTTGSTPLTGMGFEPTEMEFWIGNKSSESSDTSARWSFGTVTSADQRCVAIVSKNGVDKTRNFPDGSNPARALVALTQPSGSVVYSLQFTVTSFDSDGLTVNVTQCDDNWPVQFKARRIT